MMIPVRCFSCGKVIADKWEDYSKRVNQDKEDPAKVLDDLGMKRYCCRRMFVSGMDFIDEFITFNRK